MRVPTCRRVALIDSPVHFTPSRATAGVYRYLVLILSSNAMRGKSRKLLFQICAIQPMVRINGQRDSNLMQFVKLVFLYVTPRK